MKPAHVALLVLATALVSALATSMLFYVLASIPVGEWQGGPASPDVIVATPSEDSPELRARIDDLQMENGMLQRRLEQLERSAAGSERAPLGPFALQADLDELAEEVLALKRGSSTVEDVPVEFKDQIAGALSEIRREEKIEAVRKYQEKRVARLEADLEKLQGWLELDDFQVDDVRVALVAQYDREEEQRRMWEAGQSDEVLAERKQHDGELFWADMQVVLTPDQYDRWRSSVAARGK